MAMTDKERQQKSRKLRREQTLEPVTIWVRPWHKQKLVDLADKLNKLDE